jgi:RNA polymerase sigma factor (sigma-70 family)
MKIQQLMPNHITEVPDGVLAQEVLRGNQQAFETLVQRYSTALFNFIRHFVGDHDFACDILQQVFLQLFVSLSTLHTDEPLKPWLFRVARNRCVDELRRAKRKGAIPFSELETGTGGDEWDFSPIFDIPDTDPLPEEWAERRELQHYLHQAIQMLPERFRSVVLLRYSSQLTFAEIGKVLQMPEATAKTYFQRAKPLLRAALNAQFTADGARKRSSERLF